MSTTDTSGMDLFSKDGELIPKKGKTFEITRKVNDEDVVEKITLHDLLVGLNTKEKPETGNSQAKTFASFALQNGFTSEEEILNRWPDVAVRLDENGAPTSRAWRLIDEMKNIVEGKRAEKAAETQRQNGSRISEGQITNALRLMDMLREKDEEAFRPLINRLGEFVSMDDRDDPKGGDMSLTIRKAYRVLGIQRSAPPTAQSAPDSTEEPF